MSFLVEFDKKKLDLHNDEITERDLKLLKKSIKLHADLANGKDENDITYLLDRLNYFENLFRSFVVKYNLDQRSEEPIINNFTFIETPEWIKNKTCTINPQNKDNSIQYSIIASLFHKEIKNNPERISEIKAFINNDLNQNNINFPPQEQDYKTFEMNNKSIALNILQVNEEKISHLYKSEFNKTKEKQVILLILTDDNSPQKQHYLAVKRLNALLKKRLRIVEIIA